MKRVFLLAIVVMAGCVIDQPADYYHICQQVHAEIEYAEDVDNEWQSPRQTIELGTGDCEDMALLFLYLVEQEYGVRGEIAVINQGNDTGTLHAIALIDGVYYDPTGGIILPDLPDDMVVEVWSYEYSTWLMWWN